MQTSSSTASAYVRGALFAYLEPRLAPGTKLDYNQIVGYIGPNQFDKLRPHISKAAQNAVRGKLALDATIVDLPHLFDHLALDQQENEMPMPSTAKPNSNMSFDQSDPASICQMVQAAMNSMDPESQVTLAEGLMALLEGPTPTGDPNEEEEPMPPRGQNGDRSNMGRDNRRGFAQDARRRTPAQNRGNMKGFYERFPDASKTSLRGGI